MKNIHYEDEKPIGYVFANAFLLTKEALTDRPAWAAEFPADSGEFYPQDLPVPCTVADLCNLYVLPEYRGERVGQHLVNQAMAWMRAVKDVKYIFTHVSNGNNPGFFYEKQGFRFSHHVLGGFFGSLCDKGVTAFLHVRLHLFTAKGVNYRVPLAGFFVVGLVRLSL